MNKQTKIAISCLSLLLLVIGMTACTTQGKTLLTNAISSKPIAQPGDMVTTSSGMMAPFSFENDVKDSNAAIIGKVVEILPSKIDAEKLSSTKIIYTDIVIEVERWLYGQLDSKRIAVRVEEGRVGNKIMVSDYEPEFILGEKCLILLEKPPYQREVPTGFIDSNYFNVFDRALGKYTVNDDKLVDWQGNEQVLSKLEQKIIEIRENK
jgi:hypothetical protein